ncbi:hypothetical protein Poli38472_011410 [Pythium oligandrum]|uniref:ABC transporter domain-containing protein n=1 Tax=Pythium oligandrum TaxID=41045 RepID=A0A8K1FI26_PYTOL|nr:hypothetical protein Poli38472_011410 [Pythium oligandrum]|eukprot:TMW64530.1 hypothetical protein Poli38472_011410 [Pythium oligandrum]
MVPAFSKVEGACKGSTSHYQVDLSSLSMRNFFGVSPTIVAPFTDPKGPKITRSESQRFQLDQGFILSWYNLSYTVPTVRTSKTPGGNLKILRSVSGRCCPGELTAVMGPSGCGKTTLLDILADRISFGHIDGSIDVNGVKRESESFRAVTSYVAQEESLLGSFTVLETLRMAAQLSLPNSVSDTEIETKINNVTDDMGLRSCQDTIVGDLFRKGLSGGQKRRLSIAIELLSNPSILLLDEPTSGLDSSATYNVMKFIVKLCEQGKTVICTIHQPSSLVFDMFTNIMLLTRGRTVFFGPRQDALKHFAIFTYECPVYANPAEYYIDLVNLDFEGHSDVALLVSAYEVSTIAAEISLQIAADRMHKSSEKAAREVSMPSAWRQFLVLLHRNSINNIRNPGIYWVRVFMYFMLSFMVGTMYLSTNHTTSEEDLVPLLFYVQAFWCSCLSVTSYVIANFIAALPGIFLIALISTTLVVLLADLNSFGWFLLNLFLSLVVAESMMHVIAAAVPHYIIGIALGAGIFGMFMLCEGFMVPRKAIPHYWIWGYYLAFHSYSFESFMYKHLSTKNRLKQGDSRTSGHGERR